MKNIILSGGRTGYRFYRDAVSGLTKNWLNILVIPHASIITNEIQLINLEENVYDDFAYFNPHKEFNVNILRIGGGLATLEERLQFADVIFVPGGNGDMLRSTLSYQFGEDNIRRLFRECNANYVGISAGANYLSKQYYSNDNQAINEGLGLLNISTFCHYNAAKFRSLKELISVNDGTTIIPIPDNDYVVLNYEEFKYG